MALNYQAKIRRGPIPQRKHFALMVIASLVSLTFAAFSFCCVAVAMDTAATEAEAAKSFCGTCSAFILASIKVPFEHAITFAVMSAGGSIAGAIVAVRVLNRRFVLEAGEPDVGLSA